MQRGLAQIDRTTDDAAPLGAFETLEPRLMLSAAQIDIASIYYNDGAGRTIDYDFSAGVLDDDNNIEIPASALTALPASEQHGDHWWEAQHPGEPNNYPPSLDGGEYTLKADLPTAPGENESFASIGGFPNVNAPLDWEFSASISEFDLVSGVDMGYWTSVGGGSWDDTNTSASISCGWYTGWHDGVHYTNALVFTADVENDAAGYEAWIDGPVYTGYDPAATTVDLKVDVDNGSTVSFYYGIDGTGWQSLDTVTAPATYNGQALPRVKGYGPDTNANFPYVSFQAEIEDGPLPDMALLPCTYEAGTYAPGDTVDAYGGIQNLSSEAYGSPMWTRIVLSSDRVWGNADDMEVWSIDEEEGLAPLESHQRDVPMLVPQDAPAGNYYMGVKVDADDQVVESDESNNLWWSDSNDIVINTPPVIDIDDRTMTLDQDTLVITLPATDADGQTVTYTAEAAGGDQAAWDLKVQIDPAQYHPEYDNYLGHSEKWVKSTAGAWYTIRPSGEVYSWAAGDVEVYQGQIDPSYHEDPQSWIDMTEPTTPEVTVTVDGNVLTIDPADGFAGAFTVNVTATDGVTPVTGSFGVTVTEDAYEENDGQAEAYDLASHPGTWLSDIAGTAIQADADWYRIAVPMGEPRLTIDLDNLADDDSIDIVVTDATGQWVTFSTVGDPDRTLDFIVPAAADYYIVVTGSDAGARYDLRWSSAAAPAYRYAVADYYPLALGQYSDYAGEEDGQSYLERHAVIDQVDWDGSPAWVVLERSPHFEGDDLVYWRIDGGGLRRLGEQEIAPGTGETTEWNEFVDPLTVIPADLYDGMTWSSSVGMIGGDDYGGWSGWIELSGRCVGTETLSLSIGDVETMHVALGLNIFNQANDGSWTYSSTDTVDLWLADGMGVMKDAAAWTEYDNGEEETGQSVEVRIVNTAPQVDVADQAMAQSQDTLAIDLPAQDADGHDLQYAAEVVGGGSGSDPNYDLKEQLDLAEYVPSAYNFYGLNDKWLRDSAGAWYYILPDGGVYDYPNRDRMGTVDPVYYDDPQALIDLTEPTGPDIVLTIEGTQLTVDPPADFLGDIEIELTATDGLDTGTCAFTVTVAEQVTVLGDFDDNGTVNGLDIPGFKAALADPDGWSATHGLDAHALGDFDGNGTFNGLDIPGFKEALAGAVAACGAPLNDPATDGASTMAPAHAVAEPLTPARDDDTLASTAAAWLELNRLRARTAVAVGHAPPPVIPAANDQAAPTPIAVASPTIADWLNSAAE